MKLCWSWTLHWPEWPRAGPVIYSVGWRPGIVLTKLDGTAKGGVVVAICRVALPVRFVGVARRQRDLLPFDPRNL